MSSSPCRVGEACVSLWSQKQNIISEPLIQYFYIHNSEFIFQNPCYNINFFQECVEPLSSFHHLTDTHLWITWSKLFILRDKTPVEWHVTLITTACLTTLAAFMIKMDTLSANWVILITYNILKILKRAVDLFTEEPRYTIVKDHT